MFIALFAATIINLMYNKIYARAKNFMTASFCVGLCFFTFSVLLSLHGCSTNYNYSLVDASSYCADYPCSPLPDVETIELNLDELDAALDNYISVESGCIYISYPYLANFVITGNARYAIVFLTDAIATIKDNLRNDGTCIISVASTLTIVLNGNIYSGTSPQTYLYNNESLTFEGAILANNLTVYSAGGGIYSQLGAGISSTTLNYASGDLLINAPNAAMVCDTINFYGGSLSIAAADCIDAQNTNIYGGKITILASNLGVNSQFLQIFNGLVTIKSQKSAINCNYITKQGGYLKIYANYGINCSTASIISGLFYANCTTYAVTTLDYLDISGGTNLFLASGDNAAAIEADGATFKISSGLVIQNSSFVTKPTSGNYLGFAAQSGKFLCLQESKNIVFVPSISGSLCISGEISPVSYTNNGKIVSSGVNFFGLLLDAKVNSYASVSINSANLKQNFGAEFCISFSPNTNAGQLF